MSTQKTYEMLVEEMEDLKTQLAEALDAIEAIRSGEVDAFIVKSDKGHELYTLKSADQTYRLFIEKMAEGAVTLNRDNVILYSNTSFAEMLNLSLAEVLGASFTALIPAEYKRIVRELINYSWQEECRMEIVLKGKNNKSIPVLLSLNKLEIDGETALSVLITDISFQKENQEQKKKLEKKDEFITIASHELKTPVTSIKGYVQLLRSNFQKEGNVLAAELLNKADLQINKLTALIGDLLDAKKIENGQLQYNEDYFDLNELTREIVEEASRISKNIISVELTEENAGMYGDRNKIGQVITNFIDNANKYSPANTTINIKTEASDKKIKFSVRDEGMGIPKEQQAQIFERFFRVNREKENTYSGLGLGLYISSEIIKRHKGDIGVESYPGIGSTFYFELFTHNNS